METSTVARTVTRRALHASGGALGSQLGPSAVSGAPHGSYRLYRNLAFFAAFPVIGLCTLNCYLSHKMEKHERPPFVKYEYMRRRTKRFPWGEGQRSLFHNPKVNPLPDGYEEDEDEGGHR